MTAFAWLNTQFSLFGLPVYWSDFIGNILALATVVLALKRLVWAWPVQILGSVFLLIASLNVHLLGNAGRQIIIIVVASWGWAMWGRNKQQQGEVHVRWASWRMRMVLIASMLVGTALVTLLLKSMNLSFYPGAPWWLVACDAWIFVGTVIAMVAQGRRWVEFWFVWIAVDVVGVPLAVSSGLYFSGIVYGIFFVLVLIGIRDWVKQSGPARSVKATTTPIDLPPAA
ncbi:nicotinamide mononucleotide transporter [Planctomonas sp. JC2975]|uniref:nicotinamide mononucleotide transporter family protein n=1 Tax=Planctomonas sp. JC2975 TaxID=2729626 RepID=UPI001474B7D6|nr:nicotinamide mononucleotide transporter family protein [Planctomonas sp. JC2975]NNC12718.1 nicotinamide mononucleotide transporter [Planctomonas sp. JC2975]